MSAAWLQTYMGHAFDVLEPKAEDIDIRDIAHSLAHQCRFLGHTRSFSSVAQHSVLVCELVARNLDCTYIGAGEQGPLPSWTPLAALLHDAHEAYLGDMPRPIKDISEVAKVYEPLAMHIQTAIHDAVGVSVMNHMSLTVYGVIKQADNEALALEKRDQLCRPPKKWSDLPDPPKGHDLIRPWAPEEAEEYFLLEFYKRRGETA